MTTTPRRALAAAVVLTLTAALLVTVQVRPAAAATCPCTIWSGSTVPGTPADSDTAAVEVGVKFRADTAGTITGVRFYKGSGNTGTHVGKLWSSTGTLLASVTFTGETATGWQQATFAAPVTISAGTIYVASYYAPRGRYAADEGYFTGTTVINGPLTALADGTSGGNGVYRYGSGGGFPNSTFGATNYWVDVVFNADTSTPDVTKPTVIDRQPAAGATNVPVSNGVSATFSESVQPSTIAITVTGSAAAAGTATYSDVTRTVTWAPAATLAPATTYTVALTGAKDPTGNQMDPVTWTFTTASNTTSCPCTIWPGTTTPATPAANDNSAVEVGIKFRTDRAGYITALRFYKGSGNTGTHVGSLWTRTGSKLASVTFTGESAAGWQQATLPAPVPVTAATTYVASYYAPVGRYASASGAFASAATTNGPLTALRNGTDGGNGVYLYGASGFPTGTYQSSNYFVDVVFDVAAVDTTAPSVTAQTPAAGSTGVSASSPVAATFSEAVANSGSIAIALRGPGNSAVPGTVAYDTASQTVTLTPSSALAYNTGYSVTVSGAKDAAGNTMNPVSWSFTTGAQPPPPPDQGPGGPIAVVTGSANPYSKYLAEILRTEGLNEFTTVDVGSLSTATLGSYDVVVLGAVSVTQAQAIVLSDWVNAGGNLIALRPSATLSGLLGLTPTGTATTDGYLKIDITAPAGAGIVGDTIQYHGDADRYSLNGAQAIATLYTNATASSPNPAVTLRSVGTNGGQAAAFTFDLARSIVLSRQGNPAWAGQDRDGQSPIRSDDMFFGGTQADWVNLDKVAIPQADEQQRLLANLIQVTNRDRKPLPRFWYFPRSLKAVVIATGDDHGNNGTAGRFDQYLANSPAGCTVADWTCPRFSSYLFPSTPLSNAAATTYTNQGFEVGVHVQNGCANFTPSSLASSYASDLASWKARFATQPAPSSNRYHCIVYSDWASQPKTELANGMRLEGNYYYWPGTWIQNRPGFMTGSGMPMRFADTDGTMIDVYQAASQMTDESDQVYPFTVNTLLDNALGPLGYYGAFDANMHTDSATTAPSDAVLQSALTRGVPLVSGRQMLTWLDGRNASSYGGVSWSGNTLSFTVSVGTGANGLTGMVPTDGPNGTVLTGLSRGGTAVASTTGPIKGLSYATFAAAAGSYTATYAPVGAGSGLRSSSGLAAVIAAASASSPAVPPAQASVADSAPPTASDPVVTALPDGTAQVSWTTNEPTRAEIGLGATATDLSDHGVDAGLVTTHQAVLTDLEPNSTVWMQPSSTDAAGNSVEGPAVPVVVPGPGVADQSWASFKRGTTKGQATIDTTALGSVTLSGSDGKRRTGTFTSGVLDAQAMVDWDRMTVHADIPDGATVTVKVRTGSTANPDKTWSDWRPVADSGRVGGSGSRFLQYQVELTAKAKGAAPRWRSVGFAHNGTRVQHLGESTSSF